jgi:hypothetical protein
MVAPTAQPSCCCLTIQIPFSATAGPLSGVLLLYESRRLHLRENGMIFRGVGLQGSQSCFTK